eukprot:1666163-Amphidinium_carterae.1
MDRSRRSVRRGSSSFTLSCANLMALIMLFDESAFLFIQQDKIDNQQLLEPNGPTKKFDTTQR